jgi:hypothetical protein
MPRQCNASWLNEFEGPGSPAFHLQTERELALDHRPPRALVIALWIFGGRTAAIGAGLSAIVATILGRLLHTV